MRMKKYTMCAVLGILAVGCVNGATNDDTVSQTSAQLRNNASNYQNDHYEGYRLTSAQVQTLVANYYVSVRGLNLENWLANFAPYAVLEDPYGLSKLRGTKNIAPAYQSAIDSFAVLDMREQDVFTPDQTNEAAIRWTANLTFKNGLKVDQFSGITNIVYNKDGQIVLLKAFWNPNVLASAHF
jgi:hypothetical protein